MVTNLGWDVFIRENMQKIAKRQFHYETITSQTQLQSCSAQGRDLIKAHLSPPGTLLPFSRPRERERERDRAPSRSPGRAPAALLAGGGFLII